MQGDADHLEVCCSAAGVRCSSKNKEACPRFRASVELRFPESANTCF